MKISKKKLKTAAISFTSELLAMIEELAEAFPRFESKYEHQRRLYRMMRGYPPRKINKRLYELQQQGLIQADKNKTYSAFRLTITGRQKLLVRSIVQNCINSNDGASCIVIFDIPEQKRTHRKFLRKLLLNCGFTNLQKSVLIGPSFLPKEFQQLLQVLDIRRHVTIIKGVILYQ